MTTWAKVLTTGLQRGRIPYPYLAALVPYMDPPVPPPYEFTIAQAGFTKSYFVNGRRMLHQDLLRARGANPDPRNSYAWLSKYRRYVDEMLPDASPEVLLRVSDIYMDAENAYVDPNFPAKPMFEAFCLGRVVELLEDHRADTHTQD